MRNNRGVRPHFTFSECTSNTCRDTGHDSEDPFEEARQLVDLSRWAKTCYRHMVKYLATKSLCVRLGHVSVAMPTSSAATITRYRDRPKDPPYRSSMAPATVVISRPTRTGTGPMDITHYIERLLADFVSGLGSNIRSQRKLLFYLF